jgi:HAD superfamily hydrolase (TIGR01509 family)
MIKGVIFDLDGTLTQFNLDIRKIKREILGRDSELTLLEEIGRLDKEEKKRAEEILKTYECMAASEVKLNKGAKELLQMLAEEGIKTAVVTRNNRRAVEIVLRKYNLNFDVVISRDDAEPKPSPKQIKAALEHLNLGEEEVIFIGDHRFDLEAGKAAGVRTGLIKNQFSEDIIKEADFAIESLGELALLLSGLGAAFYADKKIESR